MTRHRMTYRRATAQTAALPGAKAATGLSIPFGILISSMATLVEKLQDRHRRRRTARQLAKLSDHALRDIGLRRGDVAAVSRAPDRFRRDRHAID